jgi:hypothetical protein
MRICDLRCSPTVGAAALDSAEALRLFGLRYDIVSQDSSSILIASTVLSAATLPVATLLTPGRY